MDPRALKQLFPYMERVLDTLAAQAARVGLDAEPSTLELEARLGRVHVHADGSSSFVSGVSAAFMARVLWKLEMSDAWRSASNDWTQQVDRFYTLANSRPVRTSTAQGTDSAGAPAARVSHVSKTSLQTHTLTWTGQDADTESLYDVRVSLQHETPVSAKELPVRVDAPRLIRVKQRKSFLYTPAGSAAPVFRTDVSLVFQAPTLDAAYELLRSNVVSSYEIEVEIIDVAAYLRAIHNDAHRLASSVLAKVCDFLPPELRAHAKLMLA